MEGLYKKVTRGYFSRINKNYSDDLMTLLKKLIKVNPKERLNASKFYRKCRRNIIAPDCKKTHQEKQGVRSRREVDFAKNYQTYQEH